MARDLNKVMLIGRLGARDPELRYMPSGDPVATFSMATGHGRGDKHKTQWTECVAFQNLATLITETLNVRSGDQVYVEGRLNTESWEKDGEKRNKTNVILSDLIILQRKSDRAAASDDASGEDA